jgi:hypothetical protein
MPRHRVASDRVWQQLWLLSVLLCGACTDTVVQEPFNPPPDQNFLGFFTTADKQTTCGNCHVTHQGQWIKTLHASAYDTLAKSNSAQPFCYTCHTVSDRGNAAAFPAGWNKVQDTVYYDVQCENCHGPGSTHVQAPDAPPSAGNPPLAHIAVPVTATGGVDSTTLANSASCGSCHNQNSGPHVRAYEEWAVSGHARALETPASEPDAGCPACHEAKGILEAWGVTADYVERSQTGPENFLGQTCAVCHDPHGSAEDVATGKPLEGQLRFPIGVPNIDVNLCMKCHQRRSVPSQASPRGPHSPQGPMLLGDAGYQPAGFEPDLQAVASTHGTDANPSLCAGCHVQRLPSKDGKIISAGHTFRAIPCLDANGLPNLTNPDCPHDVPSRSWAACTPAGCHVGGPTSVVAAFTSNEQLIDPLVKQIWDDKNRNNAVDPAPTDGGFLSNTTAIPLTEYATNDNKITPAEGALFNVRMLDIEAGTDGSHGVHNPFLARSLLAANITELQNTYPGLAPPAPAVQALLRGPVGDMMRRQYHPKPKSAR